MPQFTLHRNYVLRTLHGHSIAFRKGEPVNVPQSCVEDAVAIGAQPVDTKDGEVLGEEEKVQPTLTPGERRTKVFEAFGIMKTRGERADFTASGVPDNRRLPALLGFEITRKERDSFWQEFRELEQEARDQAVLDAKNADAAEPAKAVG